MVTIKKEKILGFLNLIRTGNTIFSYVVALAGYYIASGNLPGIAVLIACLCVPLNVSAGNILNDFLDIKYDIHSKRKKPLVSGVINQKTAFKLSVILFAVSFAVSFFFPEILLINIFSIILIIYYDKFSKNIHLLGNVIVSSLVALAVLFGSIFARNAGRVIYLALSAFFINLARELVKDIEDMDSDKKTEGKTFPILYGIEETRAVILSSFFLTFFPFLILVIQKDTTFSYLGFSIVLILGFISIIYTAENIKKNASIIQKIYKMIMVLSFITVIF